MGGEECLVSTVHTCVVPQVFLDNLETAVILVCVAQLYVTESCSHYIWMELCSINKALSCALGNVGKQGMSLKDKQLMATQHVYYGKDVFVWLPRAMASPLLHMYVSFTFRILHGVAAHHNRVTYFDELYRECNESACICVNSGYQALFSTH